MLYPTSLLALLALSSASIIPINLHSTNDVLTSSTVLSGQIEASIAQAVYITQNLDSEIKRIRNTISADPLFQLHPTQYDTPSELSRAFTNAQNGIEALPTLDPKGANTPKYLADAYLPLVAVLGDTLFLSLLDLRELSQAVLENQMYDSMVNPIDQGSYSFVLAMNDKYQGFGCALSDKVGRETMLGQALQRAVVISLTLICFEVALYLLQIAIGRSIIQFESQERLNPAKRNYLFGQFLFGFRTFG